MMPGPRYEFHRIQAEENNQVRFVNDLRLTHCTRERTNTTRVAVRQDALGLIRRKHRAFQGVGEFPERCHLPCEFDDALRRMTVTGTNQTRTC